MRCKNCPCSSETHYAESYEVDWVCEAGKEDESYEDKSGDWGCNIHYKTARKIHSNVEDAWIKDKEQFVEWAQKEGII